MKICFVAPNIYPSLSKKYPAEKVGGAELQQIFIGKALRDSGYDVLFITQDYGQSELELIDNIKVYKTYQKAGGLYVIRYIYPRLFKIWKALIRADADIYYTRTATFLVGILAVFSNIYGKKFIFASGSDTDFIPNMIRIYNLRDKVLYKYGLKRATAVIVQSSVQKELLWENFGLNSIVIRNFIGSDAKPVQNLERKYILWVSTIKSLKRPIQFIKLAKIFPDEEFVMIGGVDEFDRKLYDKVKRESDKLKNLAFLGFQPFDKTENYFDKCKIFINTSKYEGFPNTFLQAWRRGVPVISYVDPDKVIKKNQLGLVVSSEQELHEALASFLANPYWDSARILHYLEKNHSSGIIDQYCQVLEELEQLGG